MKFNHLQKKRSFGTYPHPSKIKTWDLKTICLSIYHAHRIFTMVIMGPQDTLGG